MESIKLVLVKKGQDDHVIHFRRRRIDPSTYTLIYSEGERQHWVKTEDAEGLYNYIQCVLHLLSLDDDPYEHVQLVIPAAPMIFLPVFHLKYPETYNRIVDLVYNTIQKFPATF